MSVRRNPLEEGKPWEKGVGQKRVSLIFESGLGFEPDVAKEKTSAAISIHFNLLNGFKAVSVKGCVSGVSAPRATEPLRSRDIGSEAMLEGMGSHKNSMQK